MVKEKGYHIVIDEESYWKFMEYKVKGRFKSNKDALVDLIYKVK